MRLDFHTHGKLAKKLPFSTAYTDWLFGEARRAGLDALCLTEHFNTLQFADVYGYIASVSRRIGDTLELENEMCIRDSNWMVVLLLYTAVITIWYYWIEKSLKKCVRFEFKSCVYR